MCNVCNGDVVVHFDVQISSFMSFSYELRTVELFSSGVIRLVKGHLQKRTQQKIFTVRMILCYTLIKSLRAIFSAVMSATELNQQSSMFTLSSVSFL